MIKLLGQAEHSAHVQQVLQTDEQVIHRKVHMQLALATIMRILSNIRTWIQDCTTSTWLDGIELVCL